MRFTRMLFAAASVGIAAAAIASAYAQSATGIPRENCPAAEQAALCHPQGWEALLRAQSHLLDLASQDQFDALEVAIFEASADDSRISDGADPASAAYAALAYWARESADGDDTVRRSWQRAKPASQFVLILQAMELINQARKIKGQREYGSLPPESRELFSERIRTALGVLARVRGPAKDTFAWHAVNLQLLAYRGGDDFLRGLSRESIRWPRNVFLYAVPATAKVEISDWKGFDAVVALAAQRTQATNGQEYYARLYALLGARNLDRRTGLDWHRMREGFEDWLTHEPSWHVRNLYAANACVQRDVGAFRRAMRAATAGQIVPDAWVPGYSHEVCVQWASRSA